MPRQASDVQHETDDGAAMTAVATAVIEPSRQKNEPQRGRNEGAGQDEASAGAPTIQQDRTGLPGGEQASRKGAIAAETPDRSYERPMRSPPSSNYNVSD